MEIKDYYENEYGKINKKGNKKLKFSLRGKLLFNLANQPKNKKILDVGSSFGDITKYFIKNNEVIALDFNKHAIDFMKEKYDVKGFVKDFDGKKLPFKDNSFDVVIFGEMIEHLFFYDETVRECSRVLKKGGLFVGSTPNAFNIRARLGFLLNRPGRTFNYDHIRFFNKNVLLSVLNKYFSNNKIFGFKGFFKFISVSFFAHLFLWRSKK
jgi:ubiquinone/menaquinone biosynthesis C-methylase UbiE